jgi:hypothetical protein
LSKRGDRVTDLAAVYAKSAKALGLEVPPAK